MSWSEMYDLKYLMTNLEAYRPQAIKKLINLSIHYTFQELYFPFLYSLKKKKGSYGLVGE